MAETGPVAGEFSALPVRCFLAPNKPGHSTSGAIVGLPGGGVLRRG